MTIEMAQAQDRSPIINVLVAEDNLDLCKLLEMALNSQPDMRVIRSLHRADTILEELERLQPHVLIIDLSMPGKQPLHVISEVADQFPDIQTIAFSAHDDQDSVNRAMMAGAADYVSKMQGLQSLMAGVRRVAAETASEK